MRVVKQAVFDAVGASQAARTALATMSVLAAGNSRAGLAHDIRLQGDVEGVQVRLVVSGRARHDAIEIFRDSAALPSIPGGPRSSSHSNRKAAGHGRKKRS